MSLGWLSEPAVLPSQPKEIAVDPSVSQQLSDAVLNKEREIQQYGTFVNTSHQQVHSLRDEQKQFLEHQASAQRDEMMRERIAMQNQQRMQQKIDKYAAIMSGETRNVSHQYLVDFSAKGMDVEMEAHEVALLNARNNTPVTHHIPTQTRPPPARGSVAGHNTRNTKCKPPKKLKWTLDEQLKREKLDRLQRIETANKEQQRFMDAVQNDQIDAFVQEMITERQHAYEQSLQLPMQEDTTHHSIVRKRKFEDTMPAQPEYGREIGEHDCRNKKQRIERKDNFGNGEFYAVAPPHQLYRNRNRHIAKQEAVMDTKTEAMELINDALTESKQEPVRTTHQQQNMAPMYNQAAMNAYFMNPYFMQQQQQQQQQYAAYYNAWYQQYAFFQQMQQQQYAQMMQQSSESTIPAPNNTANASQTKDDKQTNK